MNPTERDPTSSGSELELSVTYTRLLRRWPFIFALAVVGGLAGLLVGGALAISYRATAEISVGIDLGRSIWLDEEARDEVMFRAQSLLLSDQTLAEAVGAFSSRQTDQQPMSAASLRERVSLTRVESSWQLTARAETPTLAADLANAWAEAAIDQVGLAVRSATRAGQLQAIFFQISCAPMAVADAGTELWACDQAQPAGSPDDLTQEQLEAARDSHGLVPPMSYSFDQRASPPAAPTSPARSAVAIAGLTIGLLAGIAWAVAAPGGASKSSTRPSPEGR